MADVLVVFATRHGSTREIADAIVASLRASGATAEARPASQVREPLHDLDLIILGGALYSGRWHRDARGFLKRHRRDLAGTPVAVFANGPRTGEEESWRRSRAQLDRALAKRPWFSPMAVTVFGGVDPTGRRGRPRRDLRDWNVIQRWARQVLAEAASPGVGPASA